MTTRALATFAANLRYEDLPTEVRAQARLLLLDFVGIALFASRQTPWGRTIAEYARRAGEGAATIIGGGAKTTPALAALANGTAGLGFELEDIYHPARLHPGPPVNGAALAAAESAGASGRDLVTSIVAGYEVMLRVGLAGGSPPVRYACHPTAHTGVFGAAAAAGRAAGLSPEQMLHALGLAGVQSSGLRQAPNEGATARRLYGGLPAQSGVQAADLAALGFTGPEQVLEGEAGFFRAYADRFDPAALTAGLGSRYLILDVGIKAYAACAFFHSALDAILAIRAEHDVRPADVAQIAATIRRLSNAQAGHDVPSVAGAQYRLPYCLAVALHDGAANVPQFTEARIKDPAVLATVGKVRTEFLPDSDARSDMPGRVTVVLRDGRTHTKEVAHPKGSPDSPLSEAERREKFRVLAGAVLPGDRVAAIESAIDRLEGLLAVTELTERLR